MPMTFEVVRLADGLNFGSGTISKNDRVSAIEDPLDNSVVEHCEVQLEQAAPEFLVPVSKDKNGDTVADDGCGDGRGVKQVFKGFITKLEKSLHRPKVFGGGLVMTFASRVGQGEINSGNLYDIFDESQAQLDGRGIDYGAHTDEHAHGDSCGCGAIDKAPTILHKAKEYRTQIAGVVDVLTAGQHEHQYLNDVQDNFDQAADASKDKPYSGKKVIEKILGKEKVVKELEGEHRETLIIINTIPGTTVDQGYVRRITGGWAQAFAVDEWRLRELSQKLDDTQEAQEKSYLSMLVYTLATAGTLTKGDLPVYVIKAETAAITEPQPVAA